MDVDGSGSVNDDSLLHVASTTPGIVTAGLERNTSSKTSKYGLLLVPRPVFELFVFASLYAFFRFLILSLHCLSVFSVPALFTASTILLQASILLLLSMSSTLSFHSGTNTSVCSSGHFALFLAPFADSLSCKSCEFLPSELCDRPISLVATEERAAEYGTVAVALRRKFGANPSRNGNVACATSDGAKCPV